MPPMTNDVRRRNENMHKNGGRNFCKNGSISGRKNAHNAGAARCTLWGVVHVDCLPLFAASVLIVAQEDLTHVAFTLHSRCPRAGSPHLYSTAPVVQDRINALPEIIFRCNG